MGVSPATKDTIARLRVRLSQAGLTYSEENQKITSQCPVCERDEPSMIAGVTRGQMTFQCSNGCDELTIIDKIVEKHDPSRPLHKAFAVEWTDDKTPKLILPGVPRHDDVVALAAWVTSVFRLDVRFPVVKGRHHGVRGPEGHIELVRAGAQSINFEPAAVVSSARRFGPVLEWQLEPTDGEMYGFKDDHCKRIAHVLRLLCGASESQTESQETENIVGTFLHGARLVEGRTVHGTSAQRYEAASGLSSDGDGRSGGGWGTNYLVDSETGETIIRVSDLQETARRVIGSSLPRGWLDARITSIGWKRYRLDGHAAPGREGRRGGSHVRIDVYRGAWPVDDESGEMGEDLHNAA